jgi:propanol-preferring alcohol dehydrogenase
METMLSARIHKYQEPLVIDSLSKPKVAHGEEVLIRIGAAGLCHSDLHLINGEWKDVLPLTLPKTPGHEAAGWIEGIGESVPDSALMNEGDLVAVFGGWGCGICNTAKVVMSSYVTFRDGQDFLLTMDPILNILWYHHTDFWLM